MTDLWCKPCDQAHPFTAGEVERLVYALTLEAEARQTAEPRELHSDDDALCLEWLLTCSGETSFRPLVDGAVASRKDFARKHGSRRD